MKKTHITIIVIVLASILLYVSVVLYHMVSKSVKETNLESAYSGLNMSLIVKLSSYYDKNDSYPESLDALTNIEYSDGATPDMLKDFKYVSYKNKCEISFISPLYKTERVTILNEGKLE